jgi:hypothetical protein
MLLGHKIGLASAYYRPTDEEMYQEYLKAVVNLTINEEYRLRLEMHRLSEKNKESDYDMRAKLEERNKELERLKEQQVYNTDFIVQLADRITNMNKDIEILKKKQM